MTRRHRDPDASQAGVATLVFPLMLWFATLLAIVVVDIGAYLVAAARAQTAADAAALAAVGAEASTARPDPAGEARRVARAAEAHLDRCDCRPGRDHAEVTVSVAVPGLVLPNLGAARVAADASAVLAPPEDLPAGPTRQRARWPRGDP